MEWSSCIRLQKGALPSLVQLVEFTVRYIFVLLDEAQRMRTARRARGFDWGKNIFDRHAFLTIGRIVGTLFLRSLERGERVYSAMLARGYSGEITAGVVTQIFRQVPEIRAKETPLTVADAVREIRRLL